MSKLEQLKEMTVVVADTGDINSIQQYRPRDATTNPSLIYQAAMMPEYENLIDAAVTDAAAETDGGDLSAAVMDRLAVNFGCKILEIVPGRVSTEVDARLSFDSEATIKKARELIELYRKAGVEKERILIKIAATWEGIEACRVLEKEGISTNMTLIFSLAQAAACADAGATLISPFVGRILDWYKAKEGRDFSGAEDPGVISVKQIYNYFKKYGYKTIVMGASFRNSSEIYELAGCDYLTISPKLLDELQKTEGTLERRLSPENIPSDIMEKITFTPAVFRWMLNENAMATEKLAEGIRNFAADLVRLEKLVKTKIANI
jgi:transaldolase